MRARARVCVSRCKWVLVWGCWELEMILNFNLWDEGVHGAVKAMRMSAKALRKLWAGPGGVRTRTSSAGTSE